MSFCDVATFFPFSFSGTEGRWSLQQLCSGDHGATPGQAANQQPSQSERQSRSSTSMTDKWNDRRRTEIHGEWVGCVFSAEARELVRQRRSGLWELLVLIVEEVARQTRLPLAHLGGYFCTQENNVSFLKGALRSASQQVPTKRNGAVTAVENVMGTGPYVLFSTSTVCQGKLFGSAC